MKLTTFAQTLNDLSRIKEEGFTEVILSHRDYSRFGKLSTEEYVELTNRARELALRTIFEWDILMTENTFSELASKANDLFANADALRVQDPGALEWCLKHTDKPLQFIAENGNHNLEALKGWIDHAQGRMDRIVLSIELPKKTIEEYASKLETPCELLGLGRILLFYTPRSLLSSLTDDKRAFNQELTAIGESEESPHKGFPILENRHGTFMFHIKEFCLLEYAQELSDMGLGHLRIDLRWTDFGLVSPVSSLVKKFETQAFEEFKAAYPQDLMRGFYLVNKTDVLFPKLKNHRLQKREGDYAGEVMEAEKGSHLAIMIKNTRGIKKSDRLKILHPKGEVFEVGIFNLRNLAMEEVDEVAAGSIALIQFVGGVWVKSQVFYSLTPSAHSS